MQNIYIIGDVHGCYRSLLALIEQLPRKFDSKICFVGDLIDRGPASADVVELVRTRGYDAVMGNHERRFIRNAKTALRCAKTGKFTSSNDPYAFFSLDESWLFNNGGKATLASYYRHGGMKQCKEHLRFVSRLPIYLEYDLRDESGRALVVLHSAVGRAWGIRHDAERTKSFAAHVLSGRGDDSANDGIFNVYGHTPVKKPVIAEFSANIDLGCVYKKHWGEKARLCALEFPSKKIFTQECIDF
ncbi:MAG: metallophosphoesterase [Campylobacter gracilis]|uniref:metallophosphoesterase n=1 Tax=Campylobacter gracilis TaxID=824 RepID=UPI0026ECF3B6|nr:metallophosphoesterase [Campylobacter gracilis]MBS6152363.1 metallophosphoesterase [Campylobacter gracilis]